MTQRTAPLRIRYFRRLIGLLLSSYVIFFVILCVVEFRKAIFDPEKFAEAAHEVGVFFIVGISSLPIAIFIAWRLTQKLLLPLKEMAQTADQIQGGEFSRRISLNETYDELDKLAASFNLAFDRYEKTLAHLSSFSSDAAHQLRTPLAAMRTTGETALLSSRSSEEYAHTIGQMLEELQQLTGMVDQLLQLAKLENETLKNQFTSCCPAELIKITLDHFAPLSDCKNITIDYHLDETFQFSGKPELLEQAFANLLDNAIRHTPENGTIIINQNNNQIKIVDSGSGIDESVLPHIFEQFKCSSSTGQTGLGLAISKRIIELHDGKISAANGSEYGAQFLIDLPEYT